MSDHLPSSVLRFWFGAGEQYGRRHKRWFKEDASFDAEVSKRFLPLYEELVAGARREWLESRVDCLARIIALDQFPRQIFRGSPRAFAADPLALEAARHAVTGGYDRDMLPVERMFAYLPFEHSESLEDQLKACELTAPLAAFPETEDAPRYALRHRDIIQRFGRFPHRNVALGRVSTPAEIEFLKQPGSRF
ncbi:MAG TPA: DUF924 family protein [Burkholderiales bacterium]|nr:DUF924 family protein [Burkholderiales bacterium]